MNRKDQHFVLQNSGSAHQIEPHCIGLHFQLKNISLKSSKYKHLFVEDETQFFAVSLSFVVASYYLFHYRTSLTILYLVDAI